MQAVGGHRRWRKNLAQDTFTSYPADRPPVEAIMSVTQGRYRMLCPGATGLEGAAQVGCEQAQLVKIGSGPVATQPPVRTSIFETRIWEGADGRLWLLARPQRARERLYVSDDGTQTWKELPLPTEEAVGTLNLSPDGKQVWVTVFGSEEFWFWELTGSEWVKRDLKADRSMVPILLQDNIWLVRRGGTLTYLTEGVPTTALAPLTRHYGGRVLRDGTVVLTSSNEMLLGMGSGTRRDWVRITTQG